MAARAGIARKMRSHRPQGGREIGRWTGVLHPMAILEFTGDEDVQVMAWCPLLADDLSLMPNEEDGDRYFYLIHF